MLKTVYWRNHRSVVGSDGIIINLMTESLRHSNLVCKYEHFYSDSHNDFLDDVAITLINKTEGRDTKNKENYWMSTLKALAPDGLNIENCVWPNTMYTTYHTI